MTCTEECWEHIEYTFHTFCKVVIQNATINAARTQSRKHKRELSLDYLTDEKHYLLIDGRLSKCYNPIVQYQCRRQSVQSHPCIEVPFALLGRWHFFVFRLNLGKCSVPKGALFLYIRGFPPTKN